MWFLFFLNSYCRITPSWVTSGTKFPAELRDTNYAELEVISGLHPLLFDSVRQQISKWYPVQISVLPRLIAESNHIPVFPPRFFLKFHYEWNMVNEALKEWNEVIKWFHWLEFYSTQSIYSIDISWSLHRKQQSLNFFGIRENAL